MAEKLARETRPFVTPSGNTIVLNTYLTGRETAHIKSILLSAVKVAVSDLEAKKTDMSGISGEVIAEQERKTLDALVVSVNGDAENAVERLLDLPSSEYEAVLKEIEKIKNPTKPENSAQPGRGTSQSAQ
jgi:hypothetical protein